MTIEQAENESKLDEKLWMTIVAEGSNGVLGENAALTIDISDYGTAEHLNNDLLESLGDFEVTSVLSNFKGCDFIENNRVMDSVFDVLVSEELTVREWQILEAWADIQATHVNFETAKLIEGMRDSYVGTFENMEELAKLHVKNNIDTSNYHELIMGNISYGAMADDILWRGLYHFQPVQDPHSNKQHYFHNN